MMHLSRLLALFGPKATPGIVLCMLVIAPIAVWHHVHLVIHIVKSFREERVEKP
jgi:hypothetical protein